MRQPSFQQWQSRRDVAQLPEALTVVVVEYCADGRGVERVRSIVAPRSAERQLRAPAPGSSRRSTRQSRS